MYKKIVSHLKVVVTLARKHWRAFRNDVIWHFSHVTYYAKHISERSHRFNHTYGTPGPSGDPFRTPLLDPLLYPFDKDKSDAAMKEVNEYLVGEK